MQVMTGEGGWRNDYALVSVCRLLAREEVNWQYRQTVSRPISKANVSTRTGRKDKLLTFCCCTIVYIMSRLPKSFDLVFVSRKVSPDNITASATPGADPRRLLTDGGSEMGKTGSPSFGRPEQTAVLIRIQRVRQSIGTSSAPADRLGASALIWRLPVVEKGKSRWRSGVGRTTTRVERRFGTFLWYLNWYNRLCISGPHKCNTSTIQLQYEIFSCTVLQLYCTCAECGPLNPAIASVCLITYVASRGVNYPQQYFRFCVS